MLILSHLYLKYGELPIAANLFRGLGALVVGLVFNTILNLWKSSVKTIFNWIMALTGFAMVFWLKIGIVKIMLIAGGAGICMAFTVRHFPASAIFTSPLSGLLKKGNSIINNQTASHPRQFDDKKTSISKLTEATEMAGYPSSVKQ